MTMPSGEAGLDEGFDQWGVANGGVSAFAGRTQGAVTSFYQGQVGGNNVLLDVIDGLWNGILSGFENLGSLLEQIIAAITGALGGTFTTLSDFISGMVDGIGDALGGLAQLIDDLWNNAAAVIQAIPQALVSGLTSALNGLNSFIQGVLDGIISAIRGIPFVGGALADLLSTLTGYRQEVEATQVNQGNFQITQLSTPPRQPAWVSPEPISDVTYDISRHLNDTIAGTSGPASTGTAHTHNDGSYSTSTSTWSISQDSSYGSYVTVTYAIVHDTVGFIGKKDSGVNNIFLEVFREASDRSLTLVDSQDISSALTTTSDWVILDLGSELVCQPGERYVVRIRNSSTVAGNAWFLAKQWGQFGPDISHNTDGATDTNKTSYTTSEADTARFDGALIGWFMLAARNLADSDQSFSDDANRASVGPLWVPFSNTGSNHIEIVNNEFNFQGSTVGYQGMIYARRTGSDANRVEGDIHVITAGSGTHPHGGLLLHCDRELSQQVFLAVNDAGAVIYTGAPGSLTQRATHATGGSGHWALYYDVATNTYLVEKDGVLTGLEWEDTGAIIDHGENFRFGGLRIARAVVDLFNTHDACTIDNWTLRDYVA